MSSYLYSFFKSLREELIAIFNSNAILPRWIDPGRRDLKDIKRPVETNMKKNASSTGSMISTSMA